MLPIVLSCEHAVRAVPPDFAFLFADAREVLDSHRGWDPGTLDLGRDMRQALGAPLVRAEATRLLLELNRSLHHPQLWSEFSRGLADLQKLQLLERYYHPYRSLVCRHIDSALRRHPRVMHLSLHSFTPVWMGRERAVDVGLLHDPSRPFEEEISAAWREALEREQPGLRIRSNEPYSGVDDGLTTALRSHYPPARYAGIEIEVNQRFPLGEPAQWAGLRRALTSSLAAVLDKL